MMHAFTAGSWNPALMKAGFAALLTDGKDDDGLTAEGALDCEKLADATRAEIVAIQGVGLLLKLAGEGETAMLHVSCSDAASRMAELGEKPLTRMIREGLEFTDYFGDGSFLRVESIENDSGDPYVNACLEKVRRMADIKSGLVDSADDDSDPDECCPVCGGYIDQDDIDVNNNTEDGYGEMKVPHMCPHCGAGLYAYYDAQDGYAFLRFETN